MNTSNFSKNKLSLKRIRRTIRKIIFIFNKFLFIIFNFIKKGTLPKINFRSISLYDILIKLTILLNIRDTLKNNINYNSFGIKN